MGSRNITGLFTMVPVVDGAVSWHLYQPIKLDFAYSPLPQDTNKPHKVKGYFNVGTFFHDTHNYEHSANTDRGWNSPLVLRTPVDNDNPS